MCKFPNGDFAFGDQGASPLEPDRQGAGAGYLRAGKTVPVFPPGEEALIETGMVVQERHTAPVGAKPAFLQASGTPCGELPPEFTRGTSRC